MRKMLSVTLLAMLLFSVFASIGLVEHVAAEPDFRGTIQKIIRRLKDASEKVRSTVVEFIKDLPFTIVLDAEVRWDDGGVVVEYVKNVIIGVGVITIDLTVTKPNGIQLRFWRLVRSVTQIQIPIESMSEEGTWKFETSGTPTEGRVGGVVVPVDKFGLLAPYVGLASSIIVATAATRVYIKRLKRRKEK